MYMYALENCILPNLPIIGIKKEIPDEIVPEVNVITLFVSQKFSQTYIVQEFL